MIWLWPGGFPARLFHCARPQGGAADPGLPEKPAPSLLQAAASSSPSRMPSSARPRSIADTMDHDPWRYVSIPDFLTIIKAALTA